VIGSFFRNLTKGYFMNSCCSHATSNTYVDNFFVRNVVDPIGKELDARPIVHKVVVAVAHVFRMLTMLALISYLPFSFGVNCLISLAGSVFYRVAIERNCPFKFSIPSCLGAMSLAFAVPYTTSLTAVSKLAEVVRSLCSIVPAIGYFSYVAWASHDEVEERQRKITQLV